MIRKANSTPAAGYLRMSSDKQDTSIADQRSELKSYADKRGYTIVAWYTDEGISGWKNKQRHGFQKLIADAPEGTFKVVLCWDQSRFSRFDPMEANYYWHILRQEQIAIETVKEGRLDFETLGGWLTASVQQHAKAEYCRSLAHDVVRGRRNQILQGKWITCPPYGYRLADGKLVVGPLEEVETVRKLFQMRAKGIGWRLMAMELNSDGIAAPRGGKWCPRQIHNMLSRETYLGHTIVGKFQTGKFTHIVDAIQRFENTHPAIIDRDLWNRAQGVNGERHAKVKPGRKSRLGGHLASLMHCGRCGRILFSDSSKKHYVCSSYHSGGGCSHNTVPYDVALQVVASKIRDKVLMGSVENLTAEIEKALAKRAKSKQTIDAATVKRQIADIDRKLEGAAERLLDVDPSLVATVHAAMNKLKAQREALAARLETVKPEKKPLSAKQIAARLWELDRIMREGDPATVRAALSQGIERIEIEFSPKPMQSNPHRSRYLPTGGMIYFFPDCATSSSRSR